MTRLRKMMLEELQRRNYSAITTRNYLRVVSDFAKHFGKSPDKLGPNELRTYQAYLLTECKLTPGTVVNRVAALRFFFVKTLKRHQFREFLPYPRDRRRLPTVLSQEEVSPRSMQCKCRNHFWKAWHKTLSRSESRSTTWIYASRVVRECAASTTPRLIGHGPGMAKLISSRPRMAMFFRKWVISPSFAYGS